MCCATAPSMGYGEFRDIVYLDLCMAWITTSDTNHETHTTKI